LFGQVRREAETVDKATIRIKVNGEERTVPAGISVGGLCAELGVQAEARFRNGRATSDDESPVDGDEILLVACPQQPSAAEIDAILCARHTPAVHERLRHACVGVAGLGGLGSNVALALTRMGLGRLVLVDFDMVDLTNLHRQAYFLDQVGRPKVEALGETLARVNPSTELQLCCERVTEDRVPALFGDCSVLVEAFDRPEAKAMLVRAWRRGFPDRPLVAASGVAGVGPGSRIAVRSARPGLVLVGDGVSDAGSGIGLTATRVGIAAHHQAHAVVRLLLGHADM
jgi:sulfur carrier protein ThiS adenylyltransferase